MALPQIPLMTADEFETFIARPENIERQFELIDGEIIEKVPTEEHGVIAGNVYAALREFVRPRKLGRVVVEVRYRVPNDQHNTRQPDVSFTSAARKQAVVTQGAVPQLPDLAVEIQSPTDRMSNMRRKAAYMLANGAQVVWLIYPRKKLVEVLRAEGEPDILTENDTLDGGNLLPEFSLPVKDLFLDE